MTLRNTVLAILMVLTVSACGTNGLRPFDNTLDTYVEADRLRATQLITDADAFHALISDSTRRTFGAHGTQAEYHSPDGRTWLVYPGNKRSVLGLWRVVRDPSVKLCYKYPGSGWSCSQAWDVVVSTEYSQSHNEIVSGDVLGLKALGLRTYRRVLPRVTDASSPAPANFTMADLMRHFGRKPQKTVNQIEWRRK